MTFRMIGLAIACVAATGCASITNDTSAPVRFEAFTSSGVEIKDVDCKVENDYGPQSFKVPATVNVRRSSKDLQVTCEKAGEKDGRGVAISRANGGMAGNILFGGGIGAIIDHNKGTAYTYPMWIQIVMGKLLSFDRKADVEGQPNRGMEIPGATPVAVK
ncbi:MAG: hypothetical protein V4451_05615 [Pseudomonadota bacterium]